MRRKLRYLMAGLAIAVASGYLFAGNAEAKYAESKSLTLTVSIEKHYEVAFDANGGAGTMDNQEFTAGVQQALVANAYTYTEHYFAGWNTEADGTGEAFMDEELITTDLTNIGGDTVTLYAQWDEDAMHTVFKIDGTCVFHGYDIQQGTGDGHITGTGCSVGNTDWADGTHKYIDTGISLYNETNYEKDYEVGFTILAYDSNHQYKEPGDTASQATFFNSKYENADRHWPGIVIRKSKDNIEITQTIKKGNTYEKMVGTGTSAATSVVITRVSGVIYYSIDGGAFRTLQDMQDTADYFDTTAWFGSAEKSDGTPMRYIDATLTDMYIKIGDRGANLHTVSFDAGGVTANPADVTVIASGALGSQLPTMPHYVDTVDGRVYFEGWYSGVNGTGDKYTENSIISHDITLHAYWDANYRLCSVDGVYHGALQECIAATSGSSDNTITLYEDINEQITVASGTEVVFDLNGHTWRHNNVAGQPVIENNGKITIRNGTITSSLKAGVINNNSHSELYIQNGARIIATGLRQAVYNNGGKLEISGDAYLSATTGERATVQNLNNGQMVITGGTIISANQEAVKVESGTLTIGVEGGVIDNTAPVIQGATNGITTSVNISMFDGILRGKNAAINNTDRITTTESGATAVGINPVATETIDGVVYKVIYYQ